MDNDILAIILAALASSGLFSFIQYLIGRKDTKNSMILGLGHDRIIFLEKYYLQQGWISPEDFENLHDYLYLPYIKMGGNGTAEKLMNDILKLPSTPPKGSN